MSALLPLLFLAFNTTANHPATAPRAVKNAACAAVQRVDVERALGVPVGEGIGDEAGGEASCEFSAPRGLVIIKIQQLPPNLDLDQQIEALRNAIPGSTLRNATGLGPRAFFLDIPGAGTQLHVINPHGRYVMVTVFGYGTGEKPASSAVSILRQMDSSRD